jgi:hypothetical protein
LNSGQEVVLTCTFCTALAIRECGSCAIYSLSARACSLAATFAHPGVTAVAIDAGAAQALAHTVVTHGRGPKACTIARIRNPRRVCHERVEVIQALARASAPVL